MVGGDKSRMYDMERMTVSAVALGGEVWVASYEGRDFVAAATWMPPGRTLLDRYALLYAVLGCYSR